MLRMRSRKTLSQYCIKHNGLMMIAVHRVLPFSLRPANEDVALPPLTRAGCERRVFGASCMSGQEHSQSDGGLVASRPLPWLEARARLGCQTAGELGRMNTVARPLRRVPAIVSFLNPQPTLSLGRGNWSSCPKAVEPVAPRRLLFRNGPHLRKTLHTTC